MIYASELIEAVQKGGLENWPTTTGKHANKSAHTQRKIEAEEMIQELYSAMYNGKWTATQLQEATGQSKDSVYAKLATLMERGKVRRDKSDGKKYQYYRV